MSGKYFAFKQNPLFFMRPFLTCVPFLFLMVFLFCPGHSSAQMTRDSVEKITVKVLEKQNAPYDSFFNRLESMTDTFSFQFNLFVGVFGLMSAFFFLFQVRLGNQENKRMNEINEAYKVSIERTTSFIGSYEQLIKLKETAQEINEKQALEKARLTKIRLEKQTDLNGKAMRLLANEVLNANYGSTFFRDDAVRMFRSFFVEANTSIGFLAGEEDAKRYWNGDIYFLMGLDQFLEKQPRDTARFLAECMEKSSGFVASPPNVEMSEVLFPEKSRLAEQGGIEGWNKRLQSVCYFYLGQNQYRLGEFQEASASFENALLLSSNSIDAIFFKYQAKFWDKDFKSLDALTQELEHSADLYLSNIPLTEERLRAPLKARLYMKLGDFCMFENKDIPNALEYYHKSNKLVEGLDRDMPEGYAQVVPMCHFRFALSLNIARSKAGTTQFPEISETDLFESAEREIILIVPRVSNPETRYILFYMLAHSQYVLGRTTNEILRSLDEAYEAFGKYCSHKDFKGYSPISNSMLPKMQIENEINEFRKQILEKQSPIEGA